MRSSTTSPRPATATRCACCSRNVGIDYERVPIDIFAGETLTDEYARINPMRTEPVLETEQGYLIESNAILTYLADGTPYLPDDPCGAAQVVRWLIYEQMDVVFMIGGLRFRLLVGRWTPDHPEALRRREGRARGAPAARRASGRGRVPRRGPVTIADIAVYGYSHRAEEAQLDLEPYPNMRAWFARVEAQPGYMEGRRAVRSERRSGRRPVDLRLAQRAASATAGFGSGRASYAERRVRTRGARPAGG